MRRDEIVKALRQFIHQFDGRDVGDYFVEDVLEAAADLLEQDGKLINSTRQVEWVSVDKKLPYHRQDCRVILNGDFSQDYPATYREYGPGPGFGVYDWTDCEFQFYLNVTHWRAKPLYNVKEAKHDP